MYCIYRYTEQQAACALVSGTLCNSNCLWVHLNESQSQSQSADGMNAAVCMFTRRVLLNSRVHSLESKSKSVQCLIEDAV